MARLSLHDEFAAIVAAIKRRRLRFAVVGGLAMAFHDGPRFTRDIDLLPHSGDEGKPAETLAEIGHFESARPWPFRNTPITLRSGMETARGRARPLP